MTAAREPAPRGERLPANDRALFVAESPTTPQVTALLTLLATTPELDRVAEAARRGVAYMPRLRAVVDRSTLRLRPDPAFSLARHVRRVDLPRVRDRDGLLDAVEAVHSQPLAPDRPLWEFVLLSNRDPSTGRTPGAAEEQAAVLWRMHHGIADGIRSLGLLQAMLGEPPRRVEASTTTAAGEERDRRWRTLRRDLAETLGVLSSTGRAEPVPSPLNGPGSARRRLTPVELEREPMRRVMQAHRASLHAVMIAILTSALRRYHLHHGASAERPLRLVLPSNQRPRARPEAEGNHVAVAWVDLPIGETEPIARLHAVERALERSRAEGWGGFSRLFPPLVAALPRGLQRRAFERASRLTNAVCTIMPARIHRLRLGGLPVSRSYTAATLLGGHGAGFTFVSGGPRIRGAIVSDPALVPDPDRIREFLEQGLAELTGNVAG